MTKMKSAVHSSDLKVRGRKARRPKEKGLKIERIFSRKDISPLDEIEWERRTAEITDDSGKAICRQENVEVPKNWSALATKIAVSKYFYGDVANGNDPYQGGRENSVRQLVHRVTRTIADWGYQDGYFAGQDAAETFYDELTWLCVNQYGAFNSPVWFNVGLYQQYRVGKGCGQRNFFFNRPKQEAERAASQYEYPQASACFIQAVEDTMEDIMRLATSEAMLFKYGSGTGSDLSTLRSTREKLSGGGRARGPISLFKVYDQVTNVGKSGGKEAGGGQMDKMKDCHPGILEFILGKNKGRKKERAVMEQEHNRREQRRRR